MLIFVHCGKNSDSDSDSDCASDCIFPPASFCDGNQLNFSSNGTCVDGVCEYPTLTSSCDYDCAGGACVNNPCFGVICESPPEDICSHNLVMQYQTDGTCENGFCRYDAEEIDCELENKICTSGTCVDSCVANSCETIPTFCDENTLVMTESTCNLNSGACENEETRTDCAQETYCNAESEACIANDLCAEVTCDSPFDANCDGNTVVSYENPGSCIDGDCSYPESREDCGEQFCFAGTCQENDPCGEIECNLDPPVCEGNISVVLSGTGICTEGVCDLQEIRTECSLTSHPYCFEGICREDPCDNIDCLARETYCEEESVLVSDIGDGICVPQDGSCDYSAVESRVNCGDYNQVCSTEGCITDSVMPGDLVITEVMVNEPGTNPELEWLEVLSTAGVPLIFDGVSVHDTSSARIFAIRDNTVISPGGRIIFAASEDAVPIADVPGEVPIYVYSQDGGFVLNNSGDSIVFINNSGTELERIDFRDGSSNWPDYADGQTISFDESNNYQDNNLGSSWCVGTEEFYLEILPDTPGYGTPGRPNTPCPDPE